MTSPLRTSDSRVLTPLTSMPLVEPKSRTSQPDPARKSSAWCLETLASEMHTPQSVSRPKTVRSEVMSKRTPLVLSTSATGVIADADAEPSMTVRPAGTAAGTAEADGAAAGGSAACGAPAARGSAAWRAAWRMAISWRPGGYA